MFIAIISSKGKKGKKEKIIIHLVSTNEIQGNKWLA